MASTTLGDIDANIDDRSSLIAALKARFGDPDSADQEDDCATEPDDDAGLVTAKVEDNQDEEDPFAYLSDFLFSHAEEAQTLGSDTPAGQASTGDALADAFIQMDKGLDARAKCIDALKVSMHITKQAPAQVVAPAAPSAKRQRATATAAPAAPAVSDIIDLDDEISSSQCSATPSAAQTEPAPKRPRQEPAGAPAEAAVLTPLPAPPVQKQKLRQKQASSGPLQVQTAAPNPNPAMQAAPQVQIAPPLVAKPPGPEPGSAEAMELAARKAAMLRRLQGAEAMGQVDAQAATPSAASAPKARVANSSAPAAPPSAPSGTSPEQFEAYRRKCWQEYYEYTSVWKKYYAQNQAEQSGKGKGKGKPRPAAGAPEGGLLMPQSQGHIVPPHGFPSTQGGPPPPGFPGAQGGLAAAQPPRPFQTAAQSGSRSGGNPLSGMLAVAAANQLASAQQAKPPEDDIHSKLLGL